MHYAHSDRKNVAIKEYSVEPKITYTYNIKMITYYQQFVFEKDCISSAIL